MRIQVHASSAFARVVENQPRSPEVLRAVLRLSRDWILPRPGQFVQIECLPDRPFALRRPFSVSRARATDLGIEIEIVYSVVGQGTERMAELRPGQTVEVVGPLGNGFRPFPGREPILVGGGRGIAPMLALADALRTDYHGRVVYGARNEAALIPLDESSYPVHVATEDGSVGFGGNVVQLLEQLRERGEIQPKAAALFSCGPNAMLHALSDWAGEHGFPIQVSLETLFGCGFGICAGCAVPVHQVEDDAAGEFGRYRFACVDGPVFDGTQVDWAEVRE